MNDQAPDASLVPGPRARHSPWPWVVVALALLVLIAAAYGGWRGWLWYQAAVQQQQTQRKALSDEIGVLRTQTATLKSNLAGLSSTAGSTQQALTALQSRVAAIPPRLEALGRAVHGGGRNVQLQVVEQLLLLANDQVQVARDPQAAARALETADARLAMLHDPRFFSVRQALATERSALQAVHEPDIDGTAIEIGQLIDGVPSLPFRSSPESRHPVPPAVGDTTSDHGWARAWARVVDGLRALFVVRHHQRPVAPLLSETQQRTVASVLMLRLDTARAALPARNAALYHEMLHAAGTWLAHYYQPDAAAVKAMQAHLAKLRQVKLAPALPDLSASLALFRKARAATE